MVAPSRPVAAVVATSCLTAALWFAYRRRRKRTRYTDFDITLDRSSYLTEKHDLMQAEFGAPAGAIAMWVADMDFPICPQIHSALRLRAEHPSFGYTYQPPQLWDAVSAWCREHYSWAVDPSSFVFSPSVVSSVSFCVRAFSQPGDAVLVFTPLYMPLQKVVECEGRRLIRHPLRQTLQEPSRVQCVTYDIDFNKVEEEIGRERVRILIFCSPHNPAGRVWSLSELTNLKRICSRHGVLILSDEIHADWCLFGNSHVPLDKVSADGGAAPAKVVTMGGPGKTFGIPGLHAGFVVLPDQQLRQKYLQVVTHTHANEGSVFATVAMLAAYTEGGHWLQQAKRYVEDNVIEVERFLASRIPEVRPWRPQATFLMWLDFSAMQLTSSEVHSLLLKSGVVLSAGHSFGEHGDHFQRLNIACSRSVLFKALHCVEDAVRMWRVGVGHGANAS